MQEMWEKNRNNTGGSVMESLEEYADRITTHSCTFCGATLNTSARSILMYPHSGGWTVEGMDMKQWLFIRCHGCGYDWALWKLGVSRE